MTQPIDPATLRRLAQECRADDQQMTRAPWRRSRQPFIDSADGFVADMLGPRSEQREMNADALTRTRNNLPTIATAIEAAAEIAERRIADIRDAFESGFAIGVERGHDTAQARCEVTDETVREDLAIRDRALKEHFVGLADTTTVETTLGKMDRARAAELSALACADRADAERDAARAEAASLSSLLAANANTYSAQRGELDALTESLAAVRLERDRWEIEARRARAEVARLRAAGDPGADTGPGDRWRVIADRLADALAGASDAPDAVLAEYQALAATTVQEETEP